jgi:hypothetical protein
MRCAGEAFRQSVVGSLPLRRGAPMRTSGVQLGGSLAGKLSFRPSSIFQSEDFASGVGRGRRCLRRAIAASGRTDVRRFDIMAPARQRTRYPRRGGATRRSSRNAKTINAMPNTRAKAPSHQVRTTAPAKGATIIRMP